MVRTVSMLPAATEIVGALGLMDHLVAVSHECDHPAEANHKPRVTFCEIYGKGLPSVDIDRWVSDRLRAGESLYTLDEPTLRALAPELILTQRLCDVCAPAYGSVEALARTLPTRPRVLNLEPASLGDILQNIRDVAAAMGDPGRADRVCGQLEDRVADVVRRVAGRPRPTVFVMEWAEPIFNAGHWTPGLVRLAGGVPVLAAEGEDSVRVAWEDLRAADPEVLVIACCGHGVERTRRDLPLLKALPGWDRVRAVRAGRVYVADGSAYFSRPGPRVVDTLEILATALHPEAYPDRGTVPV
ncbi:MAG: cobalamin-binding protein [Gemmataceae bacterium]|nr:cobalamin-binding protein [Gemmataceae bacterium]